MQFWENILNTALIGIDKKQLTANDIISELAEPFELINSETDVDKEEKFLQVAAVAYNFRQRGTGVISREAVTTLEVEDEDKTYCNTNAKRALKDIRQENSNILLKLWLHECSKKNRIVTTDLVPTLLNVAINQKPLRSLIAQACGNWAVWLSAFNPDWNYSNLTSNEELWQTGSPEQRRIVLQQLLGFITKNWGICFLIRFLSCDPNWNLHCRITCRLLLLRLVTTFVSKHIKGEF